jgi:uncharacterized protein
MHVDWKNLIALFLFSLSANEALAGDVRPSFDCSRATSSDEQQICKDAHLAELDQAMTLGFGQALKAGPKIFAAELMKEVQKGIRAATRDRLDDRRACGTSTICILDAQVLAISYLEEVGSKVPVPPWVGEYRLNYANQHLEMIDENLPKVLGHCTRTKIISITGRFGETLKWPHPKDEIVSGTAVRYANGAYQVSYNYEEEVARSHVGDDVLLCLSTIPRHCPPGDDRGRLYSATTIEAHRSWIMSDSQHICGGA